jgi:soluble lytic murein transglycosylase
VIFVALVPLISVAQSHDETYMQAKKAAMLGKWDLVTDLSPQLQNHPLHPYLRYYYLNRNFKSLNPIDIQYYIQRYPQSPMAAKLRRKQLEKLAKGKHWRAFIDMYKPSDITSIQCKYFQAMQATGQGEKINKEIKPLWLVGKSQPDACSPAFKNWLNNNPKKTRLLWKRFELSLAKYNFGLANHLAGQMPSKQQREAQAIITLYSKPHLVTKAAYLKKQPSAEVISYGLFRLGRRSPELAIRTYNKLNKQYKFTKKQQHRIFKAIALRYSFRKNRKGLIWYRKLIGADLEPVYQEWMIRIALVHGDWKLVKESIEGLPKDEQAETRWRYWYARALDKLGKKQEAQKAYASIANIRSYHGFLASQYCKKYGIHINHTAPKYTKKEIESIKQKPAYKRAKLLYQLKQKDEARLELYYLMKHSTQKQQYLITKLVTEWGWTPQALRLTNMAEHKDDVHIRFPLAHTQAVETNAKLRKINQALVYALIRQESYFMPQAKSHAGAIGLMQLMPATAHKTAKQYKLNYKGSQTLLNSQNNIRLGTAHLRQLHKELYDNPILVIAAYNAGRHAVVRWLPKNQAMPADIWIETIPYYETRKYLKNVVASHVVYQYRLGETNPSLSKVMKSVKKQ